VRGQFEFHTHIIESAARFWSQPDASKIAGMTIETISEHRCYEGVQGFYRHASATIGLPMRFSVFRPPQAEHAVVPTLFYLAGLTGNEESFAAKGGAQRLAAQYGLMLVTCDTSPRKTGIEGEADDWEFGSGAGFYLNATQAPWSRHFRMYDYVRDELCQLILGAFPASPKQLGIFGHSMGGHGALTIALKNPDIFRSVSAFAPICSPSRCPWGLKAFPRYLGSETSAWTPYDAVELVKAAGRPLLPQILVDQGLADKFLTAGQLLPELLEAACQAARQPLRLRRHAGYDHNYYFISTFVGEHLEHHAKTLAAMQ
jgi:S-formylglutathione hydrolase